MESGSRGNRNESRQDGRSRRQVQVFIVCLLISAFTWLLIKLSREYITETAYPVVYINLPAGMALNNDADSLLYVTNKSSGYFALIYKLFYQPKKLIIDLGNLKLKKNGNYNEAIIESAELEDKVSKQVNTHEKLLSVSPKSLFFRFESTYQKKIPVKINLDLQFEKQYGVYNKIYVYPDSVIASGPGQVIDQIKEISTENQNKSGLKESFYLTMFLQKEHFGNNITFNNDFVRVFVPVTQFTESSVTLPVLPDSVPGRYSIKTYPEKVKVTFKVALRDFNKVSESMFSAVIRTRTAINEGSNKTKVELNKYPDFIKAIRIEPEHVEYIIIK